MGQAPAPPPHTPILITKGGGAGFFDQACKEALAKMGFKPEDFGSHEEVKARIKEAQDARKKYEKDRKDQGLPLEPDKPTAHIAMLARSQAGHLSRDAMFRNATTPDGKKAKRGNACANVDDEARGYDTSQAPCMPMQTNDGPNGGGAIGSPHWRVSQAEAAQAKANPREVTNSTMAGHSDDNVRLALNASPEDKVKYNAQIKELKETDKKSKADRMKEARKRRDESASIQQKSAKEVEAEGGMGDKSGSKKATLNKAADCIKNFREHQMDQMRRKAIDKYGKDYDATKKAADDKAADASAAAAKAKQDYDDKKKEINASDMSDADKKKALQEEGKKVGAAKIEEFKAKQEQENVKCMNQQVRGLCGVDPAGTKSNGQFDPATSPNPPPAPPATITPAMQGYNR
jgi:hypothetical protein